tara:strand:- start:692 stop:2221 length:1530 start_codon:yes stop_codon:yes gene_type:complete
MKTAIATTLATATLAANPAFPVAWNADSASKLILWQGGTKTATGACCSTTAPQCKVQAQAQSGTAYTDGPNNRTALVAGGQAIFNFYKGNPSGKVMQFSAVQNGTAWECKEYCPFEQGEDEYFNPLLFDPSATDQGKVTVEGKTYESYHWFDELFKVVKMDEQLWYVDESGTKPVPFENIEKLTPFGGAEIAEMTAAWNEFTEGVDASMFNVNGLASCAESQNCGSNNNGLRLMGRNAVPSIKDKKNQNFLHLAQKLKNTGNIPSVKSVDGKKVKAAKWSNDWSATETSAMLINQGGQPNADGSAICCDSSYSSQCQIQQQYSSGTKYYDFTNNRTRLEDPINGINVVDYVAHKDMLVVHNGTHDVCQKYCPIDPRDTMDAGRDIFLDSNATDLGKGTYENKTAEHWQWKETILKVITMQTTDFYADISGSTVLPLGEVSTLTPFGGPPMGQQTASWTNFKAGPQPASKFDIQGMDTCPQDPQCGQNSRQLQRLASKNLHTFYNYLEKM